MRRPNLCYKDVLRWHPEALIICQHILKLLSLKEPPASKQERGASLRQMLLRKQSERSHIKGEPATR
jgi:hypothetical protein